MSSLTVYALGGTGINIAHKWLKHGQSQFIADATIVGLDTSPNNIPKDGAFVVEHMEGTRGGGKIRKTNYPGAQTFIEHQLTQHKPGDFVVLIYGTSGATGGLFGPMLVHEMLKRGIPVFSMIIGDLTTAQETNNTALVFKSLDNQRRQFETNVVFDYIRNDHHKNRGAADEAAIQRLDFISLFLTDTHEEADYQDVANLLRCNTVRDIPATLCKANFYVDLVDHSKLEENVVASMDLFRDGNEITSPIGDLVYRVTGVIDDNVGPKSARSIHMLLDHDNTVREIQKMIAEAKDRESLTRQTFKEVESLSESGGDSMGIEL